MTTTQYDALVRYSRDVTRVKFSRVQIRWAEKIVDAKSACSACAKVERKTKNSRKTTTKVNARVYNKIMGWGETRWLQRGRLHNPLHIVHVRVCGCVCVGEKEREGERHVHCADKQI